MVGVSLGRGVEARRSRVAQVRRGVRWMYGAMRVAAARIDEGVGRVGGGGGSGGGDGIVRVMPVC